LNILANNNNNPIGRKEGKRRNEMSLLFKYLHIVTAVHTATKQTNNVIIKEIGKVVFILFVVPDDE